MIDGVVFKELVTHTDEQGCFREVIRTTGDIFKEGFGQWSHSLMHTGVAKAWQIHQHQIDWWDVGMGTFELALHDTRSESPSRGELMGFFLGDQHPARVVKIPPGVAHGCRAISGPTHLFYITSQAYDPAVRYASPTTPQKSATIGLRCPRSNRTYCEAVRFHLSAGEGQTSCDAGGTNQKGAPFAQRPCSHATRVG